MVGKISFEIKGAREMERLLLELGDQVAKKLLKKAIRAGAKPVVAEMRRLVPVRTGALRKSITVQAVRARGAAVVSIGFAKPVSRRAHLIEFGTAHHAANPFFRPALDSKAAEVLEAMAKTLARDIEAEAEKLAKG